jgi:hypothetical protein
LLIPNAKTKIATDSRMAGFIAKRAVLEKSAIPDQCLAILKINRTIVLQAVSALAPQRIAIEDIREGKVTIDLVEASGYIYITMKLADTTGSGQMNAHLWMRRVTDPLTEPGGNKIRDPLMVELVEGGIIVQVLHQASQLQVVLVRRFAFSGLFCPVNVKAIQPGNFEDRCFQNFVERILFRCKGNYLSILKHDRASVVEHAL